MEAEQEILTLTAASYRYYRFVAGKLQGVHAGNTAVNDYFSDY